MFGQEKAKRRLKELKSTNKKLTLKQVKKALIQGIKKTKTEK